MKAWKFQVVQNNQSSHEWKSITHQQAFIRFMLGFISFLTLGAGFIYQVFNRNNLAWHDQISHTLLMKNCLTSIK